MATKPTTHRDRNAAIRAQVEAIGRAPRVMMAPEPAPVASELEQSIERVQVLSVQLSSVLESLTTRLDPVLRPVAQTATGTAPSDAVDKCKASLQLDHASSVLNASIDRVYALMDRLAV